MKRRTLFIAGLVVTLILAGVVSFYASSAPDGLNKVAEDKGFAEHAEDSPVAGSPLADYGVKGVENERVSGGLAGVIGVLVVLALGTGVAYVVRRRRRTADTDA
jgi:uncharacterized protein HemX